MTDYIREILGKKIPKIIIFSHLSSRRSLKHFSDKILLDNNMTIEKNSKIGYNWRRITRTKA